MYAQYKNLIQQKRHHYAELRIQKKSIEETFKLGQRISVVSVVSHVALPLLLPRLDPVGESRDSPRFQ